ncbi:MAG: DUF1847 domain-containing protein [Spirochaetales bacterium]|nr:DUF1847 domain-containing protein [Spirochaetales bacterium]MCF7939567.1 DUF1847 domain-containing protein [Spirochaetales bacterium]
MKQIYPQCAFCPVPDGERICQNLEGRGPEFCPTLHKKEETDRSLEVLKDPEILHFAQQASIQEAECYDRRHERPFVMRPVKPRLQEIIEFSRRMGYKRLGLAFCEGLKTEAKTTAKILIKHGFEVVSVMCCAGGIPKESIGLEADQKIIRDQFEPMCNPIGQAEICNEAETELNILLGLCVGHDSLFMKHAKAYCTVFAVKDRVLGHNPLALVYNAASYYRRYTEGQD